MSDAVTDWNGVLLEVIRKLGGPPTIISRGGAMMHGAIYDAVNSIIPTHEPYLISVPTNPTASIEAAIAYAAHDTLAAAFPSSTVDLVTQREMALNKIPSTVSAAELAAGKHVGETVAARMIQERANDGADDNMPYVNGNKPGDWRPTGSGAAASPNWPKVKPFCMTSGSQFRPPRPGGFLSKTQMLASLEYAAQFNDVKDLGEVKSTMRTQEQTNIAFFWANDVDGTYKPPGQLFQITQDVSALRGLDIVENARLFALVALAMADAGIVAWDAKYATDLDLWRPETAIHEADPTTNPDTSPDPGWTPLSVSNTTPPVHFSPNFPAYTSGHATFGAVHAGIMRLYFGTDNVTFEATTEDPNAAKDTSGVPLPRLYHSFTAAALENARSRIYLGVHFQWDGDHGFQSGTALAEYLHANCLRPLAG